MPRYPANGMSKFTREIFIMSGSSEPNRNSPEAPTHFTEEEVAQIRASLNGLRYGSVQITVQDGVIVQIDRTEKRRLRRR